MTVSTPDRLARAALGTTALLAVTDPAALTTAEQVMMAELEAIDEACSRFRPDSDISLLHAARGAAVTVGPMLAEAVSVALRAAEQTDGLVDPTVGTPVPALGYDRDFADAHPRRPAAAGAAAGARLVARALGPGHRALLVLPRASRSTWAPPQRRWRPTGLRPGRRSGRARRARLPRRRRRRGRARAGGRLGCRVGDDHVTRP